LEKENMSEPPPNVPMSGLVVKELTPSLRDDFLFFFDNVAFADNPDWSDCYCYPFQFADRGRVENRRAASNQIGIVGSRVSLLTAMENQSAGVTRRTVTTIRRSTG
jgi:hypothetical protein